MNQEIAGEKSMVVHNKPQVTIKKIICSDRQWTGVAVTKDSRIFVNYPRWSDVDSIMTSVAELRGDRRCPDIADVTPYPNAKWNSWHPGSCAKDKFVCVQSVHVDDKETLWILDSGNPKMKGVEPGGPKLIKVNPKNEPVAVDDSSIYRFEDPAVVLPHSYLNDVRVDTRREKAFITDSEGGALIVVDLKKKEKSRRVLVHHPSANVTQEEDSRVIGGQEWTEKVHADSIALSPCREFIYYKPLTHDYLYRISTTSLLDLSLSDDELGGKVEPVTKVGPTDGIEFGVDGFLYLTALKEKEHAVIRCDVNSGDVETVFTHEHLHWPDSFAVGADGSLYITTSNIHLGDPPPGPFRLFHIQVN